MIRSSQRAVASSDALAASEPVSWYASARRRSSSAWCSLWLGHESVETTQIYLHADLRQKEEALAKVTPSDLPPGRFRPDDELLPILEGL